ncbi:MULTISPECIES: LysR family transcriptional regulator [unclassified Paraburkholderia]|uniref:LysR family transcriptional regulator n=1 Tax=unclassified Paraburkholderia TaxID=2615204 RepID=UPI002AB7061D|nr:MULTISPECIES: LysR family transcriptional regulator [unclassified Paraburkholderia]
MKLHQLRALVAVARAGSVHEGARLLCVTQPAVTRALRDLEDEVGLLLMTRSSSGVTLTSDGRVLLARAELIVNEILRTENALANLRDQRQGCVTIGVTPLAGISVLPGAYDRFRQRMPDVALEFVEHAPSQLVELLKNGELDFALAPSVQPREFATVRCVELATFPMWFAVSRRGGLTKAKSLIDLQDAEWLHTGPSEEFRAFLAAQFAEAGLPPPRRVTRCASQALYYGLALNANVVTSWTHLALRAEEALEHLQTLDLIGQPPARRLYLLFRRDAVLTAMAQRFVDCITETIQAIDETPRGRGAPARRPTAAR